MPPSPSPSPLSLLRSFAARPLVRDVLKVLTGNVAGNALNILTMVWIGVALSKDDYFLLGWLTFATMALLAQLSDFGLNTTIVKYYRDFAVAGRASDAEALMRRALWIRLAILAILIAACLLFARPILTLWLKRPDRPEMTGLFRLSCLGILGAALWSFCQSAMQARQQFTLYAMLTMANHVLRLGLVALAVACGRLTLASATAIIVVVPFLGVVSSARLWPRAFWTARMDPAALRRQLASIFHLSKWIFLSSVITTVIMRLDYQLLAWFAVPDADYTMAVQLAQGIPLIVAAVSAVLLPRLAATRRRAEIRRLTGLFLKSTPLLAAFVFFVIAAAHLAVPLLKGGAYAGCLPVFDLLVIGSSISIVLNPLSFFCLALERASWLTWMNLAQLALNLLLSVLLIPRYGALGAGISALLVRLFAVAFLATLYPRLLRLAD